MTVGFGWDSAYNGRGDNMIWMGFNHDDTDRQDSKLRNTLQIGK